MNVLLIGRHGTGKTQSVKALFNEYYGNMGEDWQYFSAATIDPWVDLVGIPKEVDDPESGEKFLDFVRPKALATNRIKAIFLDELNRAHDKVLNAVMELIQFKSINGKVFPNLEVVWAAINPHEADQEQLDNSTYAVQQLDAALKDRFHYHIEVPYEVDEDYFVRTFGEKAGGGACAWWNEQEMMGKLAVSPRRLETAVDCVLKSMPIKGFVIPSTVRGTRRLQELIKNGSPRFILNEMLTKVPVDTEKIRKFMASKDNMSMAKRELEKDPVVAMRVIPYIDEEVVVSMTIESDKINNLIFQEHPLHFEELITRIAKTSSSAIKNQAQTALNALEKQRARLPKDPTMFTTKIAASNKLMNELDTVITNNYLVDADAVKKVAEETKITIGEEPDNTAVPLYICHADAIINDKLSSTNDRVNSIIELHRKLTLVPTIVSEENINNAMCIIDNVVSRSQLSTIRKPDLVITCNQLIAVYLTKFTLEDMKGKYPHIFGQYLRSQIEDGTVTLLKAW